MKKHYNCSFELFKFVSFIYQGYLHSYVESGPLHLFMMMIKLKILLNLYLVEIL